MPDWRRRPGGADPSRTNKVSPKPETRGCEQRGCAMALVVVGHGTGTPLLHRQARLGTIERLDLAHMGICESRCSDQKSIVNPRSLLRIQGLSPFA